MAMVVPMRDKAQCKHKRKRVKLLPKVRDQANSAVAEITEL